MKNLLMIPMLVIATMAYAQSSNDAAGQTKIDASKKAGIKLNYTQVQEKVTAAATTGANTLQNSQMEALNAKILVAVPLHEPEPSELNQPQNMSPEWQKIINARRTEVKLIVK